MSGIVETLMLGGQPAYCLRNSLGDQVLVLKQGGQVLSWMTGDGIERLYLSPLMPEPGQAMRGGVPVIFPQFNQRGPDFNVPRHGFARNLPWEEGQPEALQLEADRAADPEVVSLTLRLTDCEQTRQHWPFAFLLALHVRLLPGRLDMELSVENRSAEPMAFTAALHSYLAVSELAEASLSGLAGVARLDTLHEQRGEGAAEALRFNGPVDDIYFDLPTPLCLQSGLGRLQIEMTGGFSDAVVWNPGKGGAAGLADMPTEDWRQMLCVEAARIGSPAYVSPGGRWQGGQSLCLL